MANQPVNQSDHMDRLHAFIENDSHDFPDWFNQTRKSALSNYKDIFTQQLKTPSWRNTKMNSMIDVFFEKDLDERSICLLSFLSNPKKNMSIFLFNLLLNF